MTGLNLLKNISFQNNRKLYKFLLLIFISASALHAQSTDDLPDELPKNLNQKQWELIRDLYAVDAIKLLAKMDTLQHEIDSLKQLSEYYENLNCEAELYNIVGATKVEVNEYRRKFEEAENYITSSKNSPNDISKNYFNTINSSKISCLPEFHDRLLSLKNILENYIPVVQKNNNADTYTVKDGDNLTSISLKMYGTANKWDIIWNFNKEEIDDPDFLYPGQIIKIP